MPGGSKKVVYAALAANLVIALTKFVAAALSGSSAMWSEGIHSCAGRCARRMRASRSGTAYFWSFVVALLVFAVGAGLSLYGGVRHLRQPGEIANPFVNYIVLAIALAMEGASWLITFRQFGRVRGSRSIVDAVRRGKDPTVIAVLFEDSAALAGLVVAAIGVTLYHLSGNALYDGAASIVIGLILGFTAFWPAFETKGLLIGEAANREVVARITSLAKRYPEVERVNEVLTMHVGPEYILAAVSLNIACDVPRNRAHAVMDELDETIKKTDPRLKRVFIESQNECR